MDLASANPGSPSIILLYSLEIGYKISLLKTQIKFYLIQPINGKKV